MALTFDDGFDEGVCASVARTLRRHDAVGTFFVNGYLLQRHPDRWRQILEGMEVGNHTRSHRDLSSSSPRVIRKQILEDQRIFESVLGRPMLRVLRPPYGAWDRQVREVAAEAGYPVLVLWTVDTADWRRGTSMVTIVRRAKRAGPGSIILMHCDRRATADALPRIIRYFQRQDIELVGLSELLDR